MEESKQLWPGWETVGVLGAGGFGSVYEIRRDVYGRSEKAALKTISIPQNSGEIEDLRQEGYDDASITARFHSYLEDIIKEYALMMELKGHGNIVYCDDFREIQQPDGLGWDLYIKMELLTPLMKALAVDVPAKEVVKVGVDLCNALILCKNKNIIHRDIKPQNIFVSQNGDYKLGDFGVARTAERTINGTKTGTVKFMAPEVYRALPYNGTVDIYSLGLVLYWLLNKRRTPFLELPPAVPKRSEDEEATQRRMMGEELPTPQGGSVELKKVVLKACAFDPKDRYQNPQEMQQALMNVPEWNGAMSVEPERPAVTEHRVWQEENDRTVGVLSAKSRTAHTEAEDRTVGLYQETPKVDVEALFREEDDRTVGVPIGKTGKTGVQPIKPAPEPVKPVAQATPAFEKIPEPVKPVAQATPAFEKIPEPEQPPVRKKTEKKPRKEKNGKGCAVWAWILQAVQIVGGLSLGYNGYGGVGILLLVWGVGISVSIAVLHGLALKRRGKPIAKWKKWLCMLGPLLSMLLLFLAFLLGYYMF